MLIVYCSVIGMNAPALVFSVCIRYRMCVCDRHASDYTGHIQISDDVTPCPRRAYLNKNANIFHFYYIRAISCDRISNLNWFIACNTLSGDKFGANTQSAMSDVTLFVKYKSFRFVKKLNSWQFWVLAHRWRHASCKNENQRQTVSLRKKSKNQNSCRLFRNVMYSIYFVMGRRSTPDRCRHAWTGVCSVYIIIQLYTIFKMIKHYFECENYSQCTLLTSKGNVRTNLLCFLFAFVFIDSSDYCSRRRLNTQLLNDDRPSTWCVYSAVYTQHATNMPAKKEFKMRTSWAINVYLRKTIF